MASSLSAATFHPIASISSSTAPTPNADPVGADRLIHGAGVGFDGAPPHNAIHGASIWDSVWFTAACGFPCDYYDTLPTPVLTLDLGQDRDLNEISIWGFVQANANGGKRASLRFATQNDGAANMGTSITFNPAFSLNNDELLRQSFAFGQIITARFVEVTITDNFFQFPGDGSQGETPGGDRVGLGEIAFAVPEISNQSNDIVLATAPQSFSLMEGTVGSAPLTAILSNTNYWSSVLHPASGKIYLSIPTGAEIQIMDLTASTSPFISSPGSVFHGLAIDQENNLLYALDSATDAIIPYNLTTGSPGTPIAVGAFQRPNEIIFDPSRNWLVVSDSGLDEVRIYNPSGTLLHTLAHASTLGAWGLAFDPANGNILYSSHDLGQIWRWDPGSQPTLEQSGLQGPRGLGYDRWGRLYCLESSSGEVTTFGVNPLTSYSVALGGRDLSLFGECDLDGDFIPDAWEANFNSLTLGFNSDPDHDGTPAIIESALNGSPLNGLDQRIASVTLDADGQITIAHPAFTKSDFAYSLWLSDDLDNWQKANRLPAVTSGGGLYDTWTYTFLPTDEGFPASTEKLFHRISVQPVE
ncbi:MAG: hypothetical protein ACSHYF_02905 [Verrucomicrobiaceae bacterium]